MTTNRMIFEPVTPNPECAPGASSLDTLNKQVRKCMTRYIAHRINRVEELASSTGNDPTLISIEFDKDAAFTTNYDMLVMGCGIPVVPPLKVSSTTIKEHIEHVVNALAAFNIFIVNANHLNDIDLYAALWEALNEEVRFLPPSEGVAEYISLTSKPESEPGVTHPRQFPQSDVSVCWATTNVINPTT